MRHAGGRKGHKRADTARLFNKRGAHSAFLVVAFNASGHAPTSARRIAGRFLSPAMCDANQRLSASSTCATMGSACRTVSTRTADRSRHAHRVAYRACHVTATQILTRAYCIACALHAPPAMHNCERQSKGLRTHPCIQQHLDDLHCFVAITTLCQTVQE